MTLFYALSLARKLENLLKYFVTSDLTRNWY